MQQHKAWFWIPYGALFNDVYLILSLPAGEYDPLPEQAFYMVGPIEEVVSKAERMAEELA